MQTFKTIKYTTKTNFLNILHQYLNLKYFLATLGFINNVKYLIPSLYKKEIIQ